MIETYKAKVRGNQITWNGDIPEVAKNDGEVDVIVTIIGRSGQSTARTRPFGLAKGEFVVPDDFDAPLSDDFLSDFEN